jgi:cytochrome c
MFKQLILSFAFIFSFPLQAKAYDLANGEEINRSCAMCHGQYGQTDDRQGH